MIALARKYRPKRFADLVAQEHVAAALRGAVAQGRVAHGYLFAGPRGVGKTTAARVLAMALNCESRTSEGEPCGACESCQRIWGGSVSLDVVELDAASNRGVDDARDLRERAMYAATTETRHKVYIVDEAHMLTREAWNALLKILEEPPPRVVFVFATTEPHKIAQAAAPILSRLQRFDFRRVGPQAIMSRLRQVLAAEGSEATDDALRLIAQRAEGGMRDGLSLLDQVLSFGTGPLTAGRVREVLGLIPEDAYGELLRILAERDSRGVFPLVARLAEAGADLAEFVSGAGDVLRAVLVVGLGGTPEGLTEGMLGHVRARTPALGAEDVVRFLTVLAESEASLRQGGNLRLATELLLLRWSMMSRTVEIGAVLRALEGGESPPPPPAPASSARGSPPPRGPAPAPEAPPSAPAAPPAPSPPPPAELGPASLEGLRGVWPQVIAEARARSPILGTLLAGTDVAGVEEGILTLRLRPETGAVGGGIERQRDLIAEILRRFVAGPLRVTLAPEAAPAASTRPPRLTPEAARAERLSQLRATDPTLNAAVDALDLELLE